MNTNVAYKQWLAESDDSIVFLDKADGGKVAMEDVQGGLKEYERLFRAGLASPAELITLHRAYPGVPKYANVVEILDLNGEAEPTVIGGPASVELVDREGHLITSEALEDAFERYMDNFRTRNVMVMHSDVQVGHALPVYISKGGQIFKSGVEGDNLFFISELRDDTKISKKVKEQINSGKMRSYSIAGSATKTKNISKGADNYMQVDGLELAEITICEKGVNQGAHFELMKAEQPIPTESDTNLFVISKEDIPSFTEVFSTWFGKASKEGIVPELSGKQMAVLENGMARQIQHRALLDEMGFPMYVYPENLRHPVDYDEPGCPVPSKIVNQAGQDLGDPNVEEMVKSATDTFINILSKQDKDRGVSYGGSVTQMPWRGGTRTSYLGKLPRAAMGGTKSGSASTTAVPTEKMNETTPVHKPNINPVDMNDYTGDEDKDAATEKGLGAALASLAAGTGEVAGGIAEGIGHLGAGAARGVGHTARGVKEAVFGEEEEEKMVKSATDAFTNILRKQTSGDETRTRTTTRYSGELPRAAVGGIQRTQQASGGQLLPEQADKVNITTKSKDYEYPTRGTRYEGKVETTTYTDAPKGASSSQSTAPVPTEKGRGSEDKVTAAWGSPTSRTRTNLDEGKISRVPIAEKGIIGDVAGAVGGAAKVGVKGVGGALAGGAAGLTGSKQNIGWSGTEKGLFRETSTTEANPTRSAKRPSYGNVGDRGFLQTSREEDEEETLKKSTDIFKRVLEAERPDETWTGTDKEKEVPIEKIIGALLAPVAGAIGAGLGAVGSAVGGVVGGAAKAGLGASKILG